eukprot:g22123.t1
MAAAKGKNDPPSLELCVSHMDITAHFFIPERRVICTVALEIKNPCPYVLPCPPRSLWLDALCFQHLSVRPLSALPLSPLSVASAAAQPEAKTASGDKKRKEPSDSSSVLTRFYDGSKLQLCWDRPFPPNEKRYVEIAYHVEAPVSGLKFGPEAADVPAFVVTDHETQRARYWLPVQDFPSSRFLVTMHLTAARGLVILASGVCERVDESAPALQTAHWRLDQPCPAYLLCVAVGKFVRVEAAAAPLPVAYFAYAWDDEDPQTVRQELTDSLASTLPMLDWIQKKLARAFPYPKYYQLLVPDLGGAMENISLTTWDRGFLSDALLATEWRHQTDRTNMHELAHSYFGNAVGCRHFEHNWLKESWAVYMEAVWLQDKRGEDEFRYAMYINRNYYIHECQTRYKRAISSTSYEWSWDLYDCHMYQGGSWRIHMLRQQLGDDLFWLAVRKYVARFAASGDLVETEDFRKCLEQEAGGGLNLSGFFRQWVHTEGYPTISATLTVAAELGNGCSVQLKQDEAGPLFAVDVDVCVEDAEGARQVQVARFDGRASSVTVCFPAIVPTQVALDPEMKILFAESFDPGEALLGVTLRQHRCVTRRIWAVKTLINRGTPLALREVAAAMQSEPFWGVRVQAADQLAVVRTRASLQLLARLLDKERHPLALGSMAANCGAVPEPCLRLALLSLLDRQPPVPYRIRSQALNSLGGQGRPEDAARLLAAAKTLSRASIVQSGALSGLGRLAQAMASLGQQAAEGASSAQAGSSSPAASEPASELVQFLLHATTRDPAWQHLRADAVRAVGEAVSQPVQYHPQREQVVQRLCQLLRDANLAVRKAAVDGLLACHAAEQVGLVRGIKASLPNQDWIWLEKQCQTLSNSAAKKDNVAQSVASLQEKVRSLETQLEQLKTSIPAGPTPKQNGPAEPAADSKTAPRAATSSKCSSSSSSNELRGRRIAGTSRAAVGLPDACRFRPPGADAKLTAGPHPINLPPASTRISRRRAALIPT